MRGVNKGGGEGSREGRDWTDKSYPGDCEGSLDFVAEEGWKPAGVVGG